MVYSNCHCLLASCLSWTFCSFYLAWWPSVDKCCSFGFPLLLFYIMPSSLFFVSFLVFCLGQDVDFDCIGYDHCPSSIFGVCSVIQTLKEQMFCWFMCL